MQQKDVSPNAGLLDVTASYVFWGLVPLYFQLLEGIDTYEVFAQRLIWSVPVLLLLFRLTRTPVRLLALCRDRRTLCWTLLGSVFISISWYLNTWGVMHGQTLLVSLAFFLTPLVSIGIGVMYLKERLNTLQWVSVVLCAAGLLYGCLQLSEVPWITIGIAVSFGAYGLIKKQVKVDTLNGLTLETLVLVPFALGYVLWSGERSAFQQGGLDTQLLLILTAPMTLIPLILFARGVSRMQRLSTLGVLQYIEPTLHFILAVFVFHEAFHREELITFGIIWLAVLIFCVDSLRRSRVRRRAVRPQVAPESEREANADNRLSAS